jgi:hypothetical protein
VELHLALGLSLAAHAQIIGLVDALALKLAAAIGRAHIAVRAEEPAAPSCVLVGGTEEAAPLLRFGGRGGPTGAFFPDCRGGDRAPACAGELRSSG